MQNEYAEKMENVGHLIWSKTSFSSVIRSSCAQLTISTIMRFAMVGIVQRSAFNVPDNCHILARNFPYDITVYNVLQFIYECIADCYIKAHSLVYSARQGIHIASGFSASARDGNDVPNRGADHGVAYKVSQRQRKKAR